MQNSPNGSSPKVAYINAPLYDHDEELIVLKSLILREGAIAETAGRSVHLFHKPDHRWIFQALDRMRQTGESYTPSALRQSLAAIGASEPDRVAGALVVDGVPIAFELEHHWEKLERKAARRAVRVQGDEAVAEADDRSRSDVEVVESFQAKAARIEFPGLETSPEPVRRWPDALGAPAYHGLVGDFARKIDPHTESDPAAIIVQFLVEFGNVVGRGPYWEVEADRHRLNEFVVLVGATSKGRKGTSEGHVRRIVGGLDEDWVRDCRAAGFGSGEALINEVRDPTVKKVKGEEIVLDEGKSDKRLMVVESEYARVLTVCRRDSNILSMILRQVWDSGDLRAISKASPVRATGAHISVVGHITENELRSKLSETDQANGFGNRHLWLCVRRSKELPEGGSFHRADLREFNHRLRGAFGASQSATLLARTDEAAALWREAYSGLGAEAAGLYGAMTSRAEAHVMRIAGIYALLDAQTFVDRVHLEAALEIWRYVSDSLAYLFERRLGDPLSDTILGFIKEAGPAGLSRSALRDALGQNYRSSRIVAALTILAEAGRIRLETQKSDGRGPKRTQITAV